MKQIYGWAGRILCLQLTDRTISTLNTAEYGDRFIGGLGIGAKIYWDKSSPDKDAFHPDNPLILMTGPLCGTTAPAAPRLVVCGKSPCAFPERFVSASTAGFFPAWMKKAGYDGIVIQGKADTPVYVSVDDGRVEIRDAAHLWAKTTSEVTRTIQRELGDDYRIMTIGPGAENGSRIGNLIIDIAGSASMGFGSVMGSKNVKAVAIRGTQKVPVADPEKVQSIRKKLTTMMGPGFVNLYDKAIPVPGNTIVGKVHCHGCPQGCWRTLQRRESGAEGIRKCQTGTFYALWDRKLHGEITEATFQATDLANDYSLCVLDLLFIMLWLDRCFARGILTEQQTGLSLSNMGSIEFFKTLLDKIASRDGFGDVLAQGALRASEMSGSESRKITADYLNQTGRIGRAYGPKSFIISAPIYAVEHRPSITELHEICYPLAKWALWYTTQGKGSYVSTDVLRNIAKSFWGGEQAVDFSTYAGKALAATLVQNRQYAKESLVLCDLVWPVMDDAGTRDHVGDPTLEAQLFTAVTGKEIHGDELTRAGERIFNLTRALQIREGRRGRQDDYIPEYCFSERVEAPSDIFDMYNPERYLPGSGDQVVSLKGKALDKQKFTELMDEYYELRGWDRTTGLLKRANLEALDLSDIVPELEQKSLLA